MHGFRIPRKLYFRKTNNPPQKNGTQRNLIKNDNPVRKCYFRNMRVIFFIEYHLLGLDCHFDENVTQRINETILKMIFTSQNVIFEI